MGRASPYATSTAIAVARILSSEAHTACRFTAPEEREQHQAGSETPDVREICDLLSGRVSSQSQLGDPFDHLKNDEHPNDDERGQFDDGDEQSEEHEG